MALFSFTLTLVSLARRERISVVRAGDPLLCGLIGLVVARLSGAQLMVRVNANNDMIRRTPTSAVTPGFPSI